MSSAHEEILAAQRAGYAALAEITEADAEQLWNELTTRGATSLYLEVDEDGHVTNWEIQP